MNTIAYDEGYEAFFAGFGAGHNPYPLGSRGYYKWLDGFYDAFNVWELE